MNHDPENSPGRLKDGTPDTSTPIGRSIAFNAQIDALMRRGLSYDAAILELQDSPDGRALLKAMGGTKALAVNMGDADKLDPSIKPNPNEHAIFSLWTPEHRRKAFNARMDELTGSKESGGKGLTTEQALTAMRADRTDASLLRAMGDDASPEESAA